MAKTPVAETKALVSWEEELAREAKAAAAVEAASAGGSWLSTRGGMLTLNDAPMAGSQVACIIVASMFENAHNTTAFDTEAITPPRCFALSEDEKGLKPHESVFALGQQGHDTCKGCEHNEYGTAVRNGRRAKGKACQNRRRLALLSAGEIDEHGRNFRPYTDEEHYVKGPLVGLKISPTQVRGYASYVTQLSATVRRPPWAVYTLVKVSPDLNTQIKVTFTSLGLVDGAVIPAIRNRLEEAKELINRPYNLEVDEAPPAPSLKPGRKAKY